MQAATGEILARYSRGKKKEYTAKEWSKDRILSEAARSLSLEIFNT